MLKEHFSNSAFNNWELTVAERWQFPTIHTPQTKMQRWTDVELRNISTMTVTMMKMVVDNKYDNQNNVSDNDHDHKKNCGK